MRYIELHARSAFSFLQGASVPEELVQTAAELDMPAMALLDRDGVYGAPRFHMAAKKAGIRAHIGAEITCTNGRQYPLLVETRQGYQNLCRLITRMKLRAKKGEGAVTPEELAEFAQGLICITQDLSLADIFGARNVFAEIQRHMDRREEARNQAVIEQARRLQHPAGGHQRRLPRHARASAKCSMCSPACATRSRSKPPAGCWPPMPSAT